MILYVFYAVEWFRWPYSFCVYVCRVVFVPTKFFFVNKHQHPCLTWLLSHFHSFTHYCEMIHPHPREYLKYPGNFLWSNMTSSWQYKHHKARDQHVYLVYRLLLVSCFGMILCHNIIIQCPKRHLYSMVICSVTASSVTSGTWQGTNKIKATTVYYILGQ